MISLAYFFLSEHQNELPKVAQMAKSGQSGHPVNDNYLQSIFNQKKFTKDI